MRRLVGPPAGRGASFVSATIHHFICRAGSERRCMRWRRCNRVDSQAPRAPRHAAAAQGMPQQQEKSRGNYCAASLSVIPLSPQSPEQHEPDADGQKQRFTYGAQTYPASPRTTNNHLLTKAAATKESTTSRRSPPATSLPSRGRHHPLGHVAPLIRGYGIGC